MDSAEKKKLLDALKVIRSECSKHNGEGKSCMDCPMCSDEGCVLMIKHPNNWILSNERTTWRAFQ